jgi:hypothetical protein
MLIKTEGIEKVRVSLDETLSVTYEVWINPALVGFILPERKAVCMASIEDGYLTLSDEGFERFVKAYEQVEGL